MIPPVEWEARHAESAPPPTPIAAFLAPVRDEQELSRQIAANSQTSIMSLTL